MEAIYKATYSLLCFCWSDAVILKEQVIPLLLNACPSFSERWKEHHALYDDEELLYVDLGEFAHHLIELLKNNQRNEFPAVFDVI